jgi:hypothetical protein
MGARVVERTDLVVGVSHEQNLVATDAHDQEVVRFRQLALEREENPPPLEQVFHLQVEYPLVREDAPMHPRHLLGWPKVDQLLANPTHDVPLVFHAG